MPRYEATTGGLTVERKYSHGWDVTHAESGREVVGGLRQRRFAEQAADLRRSHAAGDGEAIIRMLKALR